MIIMKLKSRITLIKDYRQMKISATVMKAVIMSYKGSWMKLNSIDSNCTI